MGLYSGRASSNAVVFEFCSLTQARALSPWTSSSHWKSSVSLGEAPSSASPATPTAARREILMRTSERPADLRLFRSGVRGSRSGLLTALVQLQEFHRVVVEDVALLRRRQKRRRLDSLDGKTAAVGPVHLIGAEHDAFAEPGPHQCGEVVVELGARQQPVAGAQVRVHL